MLLNNQTLKDAVVEQIRDEIITGQLQPGQKLRQEELAAHFGVSAVPVREALRQLEAEGMVSSIPRRGVVVTRLSSEDMRDIYDIRINLEEMATLIAVPLMDQATLDKLNQMVENMDLNLEQPSVLTKLNHEFHLTIYQASGRKYLHELIEMLRRRTQHYVRSHISDMNSMPKSQEQHRMILEACQSGDAHEAAACMRRHIERVGQELVTHIQASEKSSIA